MLRHICRIAHLSPQTQLIFIDMKNNMTKLGIVKDTNGIQSNCTLEYIYTTFNFETALFEKL